MYDVIGTIYTNPDTSLPGWHVNSPYPVESWEQYQVEPKTPMRVFAGHPTYCYVFESEEAYEAIINPPVDELDDGQP